MNKKEFIEKYKLQSAKGYGNAQFDRSEEMERDLDNLSGLPESKEIDNNGDWLSPIQSEREHQEKQLKELWPDYPNGCPKWQTMNGLLFYTNKFMELDSSDGWIPITDTTRRPEIIEIEPRYYQLKCLIGGGEKGTRLHYQTSKSREELMIFFEEDSELKHNGFTHWQPLPAVPQGEKGVQ